ncbi:glycosyltransferase involved in cell wall biosynthesis [Anseongella ginsenosidimutans]|uniref:Glycosyltransferase involved in cell wall biosynthesis n=1 Tax=Anseongella ginsenosidimutans TaxID=496056 RepID=A0A4R3KTG1_9SPHI|nr:glycosyltransferase family 2 protein [Anseongella ginsenosidimutans]QEC53357.1 glycosyltransferase family 2 protein [Anseongella ginsenosidimutans]TCS88240.1 glycosyltransferase involved in cell wall biosynthesis [Anseongella ginsenosidimutans]
MISIIIPCYNCVSTIKRAVDSVLNQKYQHYELLLVDNRSSDGTIHLLNHYKERFPEKIRVFHEYKRGAPAARNKGLSAARGEWIQFLDADDELHPEKLSRQLDLATNSMAGIVIGNYILEWIKGKKRLHLKRPAMSDPWEGLVTSNLGITSSNLWKKKDLLEVNGWNERLTSSQEYDLLFRLLKNRSEVVFDEAFYTMVYHNRNSTSKSTDKKKLIQIVRNRINLRREIKEYLILTKQLTANMNRTIDTYIYFELKRNSPEIFDYVKEYLKQNQLEVPWNTMIKINSRIALRKLLYYIQGIYNSPSEWDLRRNLS